jgi:uncharacterized protein (TIGR03437 family)
MKRLKLMFLAVLFCNVAFGQTPDLCVVSAADFGNTQWAVAPESMVSIFVAGMASGTFTASDESPSSLPTILGGVSATITDLVQFDATTKTYVPGSTSNTQQIAFIAVTPNQANAVLPATLKIGSALVKVTGSKGGTPTSCLVEVQAAAPSLFSADNSGGWLAAAQVVIVHSDGKQTLPVPVAEYSKTLVYNGRTWSNWIPVPIDLGSSTDVAILELFGTGIRGYKNEAYQGSSQIGVEVNGVTTPLYAGAQGLYYLNPA